MKEAVFTLFVFFLSCLFVIHAGAGSVSLPQTGQMTCYDTNGDIIACTGSGQDGDYSTGEPWPSPRFQDNGDGTLTDLMTGLTWLADANCADTVAVEDYYGGDGESGGLLQWLHALEFVADINTGVFSGCAAGHTDWRLPNINELESLVDAETSDGSMLTTAGFANVDGNGYWSATHDAYMSPWNALFVDLRGGALSSVDKVYVGAVLPVRGGRLDGLPDPTFAGNIWATGQSACHDAAGAVVDCADTGQDGEYTAGVAWPVPRFNDNTDGTVTDLLSGLTWLQDANCIAAHYSQLGTNGGVNWQAALDFVDGINDGTYTDCAAGQTDWRLPNRKEMRSLVDYSQSNPALPSGHPFTNTSNSISSYWTGSTYASSPSWAWALYHKSGLLSGAPKDSYSYLVWPVRGSSDTVISGPQISVAPLDIPYDDTAVGDASDPVVVTISNFGDEILSISSIALGGDDADDFALSLSGGGNPCGQTDPELDAASACTVSVSFAPQAEGAAAAVLSVLSNDGDNPQVDVSLSGNGTPAAVVTFADPNLESAIREVLELPEGDILQSSLTTIVELIAPSQGISDLSGLAYCTNLDHLNLSGNAISDLSPLAGLTSLTYLNLYNNAIEDISHLSGLTDLIYLNLGRNLIVDISALDTLGLLEVLYLDENQISDITALTPLVQLQDLGLGDNAVADLSALTANGGLDSGDRVWLEGNLLDTASTSQDARDVRTLQVRGVDVFYDPFDSLFTDAGLDSAIRSALGLQAEDIILPDDLLSLTVLDASNTNISDLSGIAYCDHLTELNLSFNEISSLADLSGLTSLNHLNLQDNQVTDISPLSNLVNLTDLNLTLNQITDIGSLSSLSALTHLYLSYNQIADLTALSELTHLTALSLSSNQIADLSALLLNFGLSSGDTVWIEDNLMDLWVGSTGVNQLWALEGFGVTVHHDPVHFVDANLNTAVGEALGGTITYAGVAALETLNLNNRGVVDISGLEYFQSLNHLDLRRNDVDDITPLVDNNWLAAGDVIYLQNTYLDLWETSPDVQNIRTLEARGVTVYYDEIAPVLFPDLHLAVAMSGVIGKLVENITRSDLEALTELDFSERNIQDITGIERCRNLERLVLSGNQISGLPTGFRLFNLTYLDLSNNQLVEIGPLSGCRSLTSLDLSHNQIQDITALWYLVEIGSLHLNDNQIESLGGLNQMENLSWLDASDNVITSIASLQYNHEWLHTLYLNDNRIEDIAPLNALVRLTSVYLDNNRVAAVPSLASLTELHSLSLDGNLIDDISGLAGLESLTRLGLDDNRITDLSSLSGLTTLTLLHLDTNQIADLTPLAGLVNLEALYLSDNRISDISHLTSLTHLSHLDLENNQIDAIGALVANAGLGDGDRVWMPGNELDPWVGMPWWQDFDALESRGVDIYCGPPHETPFTDSTTEQQMRAILDIPEGPISMSDLAAVTELHCRDYDAYWAFQSLEGFQHFTNLTDLDMSKNPDVSQDHVDLTPLASLTQLERLRLASNSVGSLQPISALTNLTFLDLQAAGVSESELYYLSGLTHLTFLDLSRNYLRDIDQLPSLTNLRSLDLTQNNIRDLSPLTGLTSLRQLQVGHNHVEDITPLSGLVNLTYIECMDNQIIDIHPIAGLDALETLYASENAIADLTPLAGGFPSLSMLILRDNHITDIQALVDNLNFGTGDTIYLDGNRLMLWYGSVDLADVVALKTRGVDVRHDDIIVSDQDGIPDAEERGPDGTDMEYDGNGDWIPDWGQPSVASLHAANGSGYVTIACNASYSLTDVSVSDPPAPEELPPGVELPMGLFSFRIDMADISNGMATVNIYLPPDMTPTTYYKYGPTFDIEEYHWYEFLYGNYPPFGSFAGAQISGNVITLYLRDGETGDNDLHANHEILDPGGPAFVTPVPDVNGGGGGSGSSGCFIGTSLR